MSEPSFIPAMLVARVSREREKAGKNMKRKIGIVPAADIGDAKKKLYGGLLQNRKQLHKARA